MQAARIIELEAALTAAIETAERLVIQVEELEAEREARPVVRWKKQAFGYDLMCGPVMIGWVKPDGKKGWECRLRDNVRPTGVFPTPEAAKAAVEQALKRGETV